MSIRVGALALGLILLSAAPPGAQVSRPADSGAWLEPYREPAARLIGQALATDFAWQRLALLGDTFGHRLSGSQGLEDAIQWAVQEMKQDGLENVHTEPVKVPHWVRGQEGLEIVAPGRHALAMLGLGNSVGTPADGIEADVLVVRNFQELEQAGVEHPLDEVAEAVDRQEVEECLAPYRGEAEEYLLRRYGVGAGYNGGAS